MAVRSEATIQTAARRAGAEVYEAVRRAALEAVEDAIREALARAFGAPVDVQDVVVEDRVPRARAAEILGTSSQTIMRLEQKGAVRVEKEGGRAYVYLSEVEEALVSGKRVISEARLRRQTNPPSGG